ncbi:hypothetical protein [Phocaeicola sp.]
MPTGKENAGEVKRSSYTAEELKQSYEKGLKVGRLQGMIAYQKKLVENLQKDNAALNGKLAEAMQ